MQHSNRQALPNNMETLFLIYSVLVVFLAGFVRGYSGFGASMILVLGLSLVYSLSDIVPAILLMEVLASCYLLPRIFKDVDWSSLSYLLMGIVVGTPMGVYLLSNLPDPYMRVAVSMIVLLLIPLLWKGITFSSMPGKPLTILTGTLSGIINGAAAIGGPPVVLFYFSSPRGTHISRASLIAFFLATDLVASGVCAINGLVTSHTFSLIGLFVIPLLCGIALGSRSYFKTDPEIFKKRVLFLLILMAITTLTQSLLQ